MDSGLKLVHHPSGQPKWNVLSHRSFSVASSVIAGEEETPTLSWKLLAEKDAGIQRALYMQRFKSNQT
jgi:hypothetical protein